MNTKVPVYCVLLCAGQSTRMLPHHKLFLQIGETSLLVGVLQEILSAGFTEVLAVTGFEIEKVERILQKFPVKTIHHPNFSAGMHSSIKAGVASLSGKGFVAICLADQPFLQSYDYKILLETAQNNPDAKLISPTFKGQRGNPVLISLDLKDRILARPDMDRGCAYLFEDFPNEVISVPMDSDSILKDLDTPEDYECLISTKP